MDSNVDQQDYLKLHSADGVDMRIAIAGTGSRSYAFLIDWHIRVILALAWFMLFGIIVFGQSELSVFFKKFIDVGSSQTLLVLIPGLALYFLYHPVLEIVMRGQTPGKRMVGIKIVNHDGISPGIGALLIRNIFRLIDSMPVFYLIGLLVCLITHQHVRIGDLAAGTLLVYQENVTSSSWQIGEFGNNHYDISVIETARELTERWPTLNSDVRVGLARKLLTGIKLESGVEAMDDSKLREQLETLVNGE